MSLCCYCYAVAVVLSVMLSVVVPTAISMVGLNKGKDRPEQGTLM